MRMLFIYIFIDIFYPHWRCLCLPRKFTWLLLKMLLLVMIYVLINLYHIIKSASYINLILIILIHEVWNTLIIRGIRAILNWLWIVWSFSLHCVLCLYHLFGFRFLIDYFWILTDLFLLLINFFTRFLINFC